ncbi:MAG: hypothetical protein ACE5LU_20430 [Anaerolineae bacterium]
MSEHTDDLTSQMPANGIVAGWPQEHVREHIVRAILIYARRHREMLHGLSEEQVRCLIEAITRKAEGVVRSRLDRHLGGIKPSTWIGAIAIREAMYVFKRNAGAHESVAASILQQSLLAHSPCLRRET